MYGKYATLFSGLRMRIPKHAQLILNGRMPVSELLLHRTALGRVLTAVESMSLPVLDPSQLGLLHNYRATSGWVRNNMFQTVIYAISGQCCDARC